jgi:hypothetical protein
MNPDDLHITSNEDLITQLEAFNAVYDELMENMVMIREELLHRLVKAKKDGEIIGKYSVTKSKRFLFKTTLEQAQELGAIKQAVDAGILRTLYDKGIKIPGVEITTYVSIRRLEQPEIKNENKKV